MLLDLFCYCEKKRKKRFIFFTIVAGGSWGGAGKPVLVGREFSIPDGFGGGGEYAKNRPRLASLPCLESISKEGDAYELYQWSTRLKINTYMLAHLSNFVV